MPEAISVRQADLDSPDDCAVVLALTDAYSRDPMGADGPLADVVRERLIPALREHPTTLVLLAFREDQPIGIATCFVGFSTFAARQLLNIHDLSVMPEARGQGVGRRLLEAAEQLARGRGYCKLTLEVLEENRARNLYESFGFQQAVSNSNAGGTLFMMKSL